MEDLVHLRVQRQGFRTIGGGHIDGNKITQILCLIHGIGFVFSITL